MLNFHFSPRTSASSAVILSTISVAGFQNLLTLPSINDRTLNVTWTTPKTPNGYISYYNINVKNNQDNNSSYNIKTEAIKGQKQYTELVSDLGKLRFLD